MNASHVQGKQRATMLDLVSQHHRQPRRHLVFLRKTVSWEAYPEGPYIQLLGNQAPKYHIIEGIMGPIP